MLDAWRMSQCWPQGLGLPAQQKNPNVHGRMKELEGMPGSIRSFLEHKLQATGFSKWITWTHRCWQRGDFKPRMALTSSSGTFWITWMNSLQAFLVLVAAMSGKSARVQPPRSNLNVLVPVVVEKVAGLHRFQCQLHWSMMPAECAWVNISWVYVHMVMSCRSCC